ncbi:MAG: universal stress protein [Caldisericota bacterium]|nr:universal stress protein [Caldisericota bacterium]
MFEKIIFPYDFSEYVEKAIPYIEKFKSIGGKEVIIIYVVEYNEIFKHVLYKELEVKRFEEKMNLKLKPLKEKFEKIGFDVTICLEFGPPDKVIIKKTLEYKADIIVIGRKGRSAVGSFFLGSTTLSVLQRASIPVLVVPSK